MATALLRRAYPALQRRSNVASGCLVQQRRCLQTLENHPYIYIFGDSNSKVLTYLRSPRPELAIGTTTAIPPTPDTFTENHHFSSILQSVLNQYAHEDPQIIAEGYAFASSAGSSLGSGGAFFNQTKRKGVRSGGGGGTGGDGAGGASSQGGMGGAGRGGYIHVADLRNPPDYGRIPDPEDIFGSLEVNAEGGFVDGNGRYQDSGTHRLITRNGLLGLTDFIREKLIQRLEQEEKKL